MFGKQPDDAMPRRIGADAWFDCWEAQRYEVHEQTIRNGNDEVLTLVLIRDPRMLEERDTRYAVYAPRTWIHGMLK
jgi:hypothetical protein